MCAYLDAARVGGFGEDGGAVLQAPGHDDVENMLLVLLGNLIDDWMLTVRVCATDDGLGARPRRSQRAIRADMDILVAAVRDELIVAPDWVHFHLKTHRSNVCELLPPSCYIQTTSLGWMVEHLH